LSKIYILNRVTAIVTSEMDMSDTEVIETYRGLWEIEETFRVTKGVLETHRYMCHFRITLMPTF